MFIKDNCSDVVKEDSLSLMEIDIVHALEFVIFTHFLVTTHTFQPAFVVISDLNRVGFISCIIDHSLFFLAFSDLRGPPCGS